MAHNLPNTWALMPRMGCYGNGLDPAYSAPGPVDVVNSGPRQPLPSTVYGTARHISMVDAWQQYPDYNIRLFGRIPSQIEWVDIASHSLASYTTYRNLYKPISGPLMLRRVTIGNYYTNACYRRERYEHTGALGVDDEYGLTYEQLFTLLGLVPDFAGNDPDHTHFAVWSSLGSNSLMNFGSSNFFEVGWWLVQSSTVTDSFPLGLDHWWLFCRYNSVLDIDNAYTMRYWQLTTRMMTLDNEYDYESQSGPIEDQLPVQAFWVPGTSATKRPAFRPMTFIWDAISSFADFTDPETEDEVFLLRPYYLQTLYPVTGHGAQQFQGNLYHGNYILAE